MAFATGGAAAGETSIRSKPHGTGLANRGGRPHNLVRSVGEYGTHFGHSDGLVYTMSGRESSSRMHVWLACHLSLHQNSKRGAGHA
jgi:hypothetical protein